MISTSVPSARRQWVKSDCQTSLGAAASNRIQELRGRLCGSGTTRPAAWRTRRMVEVDRSRQALAPEMPGDRGRARVEAAGDELDPEGDDPVAHRVGCPVRAGVRPARARLEAVEPVLTVPAQEPVEVAPADAALLGRGGDGQLP